MRSRTGGFSLIELVIALLVGGILVSIASPGISGARARYAVTGARGAFTALHARARAQAIERGTSVRLIVDTAGDSVSLSSGGQVLETVRFAGDQNVDITATPSTVVLCMTPRGYADTDCNNFSVASVITFSQNAESAMVVLLPPRRW